MRCLVINNNTVVNVIVIDSDDVDAYAAATGYELVQSTGPAGIGWSRVDGEFVPPETPEEG